MARWVLHVDLDQFIAAVEVRRRPELAGLPVVVGGDGDPTRPRQVVATATYEARAKGVRSGVPMARALRLCPEAVFLPHDAAAYDAASQEVMTVLRTLPVEDAGEPVPVEVLGWDEAFLGYDGEDPRALADLVRAQVRSVTGLSCAVGIGDTKVRAKTATGFAKPGGVAALTESDWLPVMGSRPTRELWGVGPRTAARLQALGVETVADLAAADHELLAAHLGPRTGPWLVLLGRGRGGGDVDPTPWVPRSAGHQTTFPTDLLTASQVEDAVDDLLARVLTDVAADGRDVDRVAVTLRWRPFVTRSRSAVVRPPGTDPAVVRAAAAAALARFGLAPDLERPVRLVGVRADFVR